MLIYDPLILLFSYLLGSISGAVIVCQLMKLPDPRTQGSGNPGATNVLRHSGKKAALITLIIDVLKGIVAVLMAKFLTSSTLVLAGAGLTVFLGHLYPIFLRFRGGKGVATALGVLIMLAWPVGLAALATWLIMAFMFRYSSLAAITAAVLTPGYMFLLVPREEYILTSLIMSGLLIWRHRSNIHHLLTGEEDKIGEA